ncbi:nucleoside hydrolase [Tropicimonas marinistellae]|uniref:nucleoside hydrolase n=1 Tax=Tropicimonas marinistellae TaxID=1739787 RepID=UPI0008309F55|nr:nucleoside hydrolase [Tropicimonas marinistellae]
MLAIIDTDPGIDDAIAILFALRHPGIEVVALTTVAGNIGLPVTTDNAGRIAALAGVTVPVHPGAAAPLGREAKNEVRIHGADGLGGVTFPEAQEPPSKTGAVAAMSDLLMAAEPGVMDLFCLGPLTNIARLLTDAPESAERIGRVVAMGGAVDEPGNVAGNAEFNLGHDPEAAAAVLAAGLDLTLIPLDATRQFRADAVYLEQLRETGAAPAIATADLIDAYFEQTAHQAKGVESRPLHDPCVPLLALHPDLFHVETRGLQVDVSTGALIPGPTETSVAMGLDAKSLRDRLLGGLSS